MPDFAFYYSCQFCQILLYLLPFTSFAPLHLLRCIFYVTVTFTLHSPSTCQFCTSFASFSCILLPFTVESFAIYPASSILRYLLPRYLLRYSCRYLLRLLRCSPLLFAGWLVTFLQVTVAGCCGLVAGYPADFADLRCLCVGYLQVTVTCRLFAGLPFCSRSSSFSSIVASSARCVALPVLVPCPLPAFCVAIFAHALFSCLLPDCQLILPRYVAVPFALHCLYVARLSFARCQVLSFARCQLLLVPVPFAFRVVELILYNFTF